MIMNIKVFAILKEFFEEDLQVEELATIADLKNHLILMNPQALPILENCRFAINHTFVPLDTNINQHDTIYIMPPSSGG